MKPFDALYYRTVDEIYHERWSTHKLLRIRWLARSIAHFWPQGHPSRLVHVAGTNGKGTVCRLLESALARAGGAGCLCNPHLFDYAERYSINGETLSHERITRLWHDVVQPHSLDRAEVNEDRALSFAEAGILLALHAFAENGLGWGIVETGVGGRYSPSMATSPVLCLLTNVGVDHVQTLGSEEWQRALEKAGIIRSGVPLLTAAEGEALHVISSLADQEAVPLHVIDATEVSRLQEAWLDHDPQAARVATHTWTNRCTAWQALGLLGAQPAFPEFIDAVQSSVPLPGRFWEAAPNLIADVAHNKDKMLSLRRNLDHTFPDRPLRVVLGLSRNRPLEPILAQIADRCRAIVFTSASYAGRPPEELLGECTTDWPQLPATVIQDPVRALDAAMQERKDDELVLLTGSAYSIDQALNPDPVLKRLNAEYGRRGTIY